MSEVIIPPYVKKQTDEELVALLDEYTRVPDSIREEDADFVKAIQAELQYRRAQADDSSG